MAKALKRNAAVPAAGRAASRDAAGPAGEDAGVPGEDVWLMR